MGSLVETQPMDVHIRTNLQKSIYVSMSFFLDLLKFIIWDSMQENLEFILYRKTLPIQIKWIGN